jgi:hypothetical protein
MHQLMQTKLLLNYFFTHFTRNKKRMFIERSFRQLIDVKTLQRKILLVFFLKSAIILKYICSLLQLHVHSIPSPHVVAARAYHIASNKNNPEPPPVAQPSLAQNSNNAIYRLARLLNQTTKTSTPLMPDNNAPRRLSWER